MPIIIVNNLSYSYPDGTCALDNVSFTVEQNEVVGIAGANGAGKTTLLNHLNGFTIPTQGTITINSIPISKKNVTAIRKMVGVIFQNTDDQLFMPRVLDDVAFGLRTAGIPKNEAHQMALQKLTELQLEHLATKPPFHLSQGQKRFVAFAGILVMRPEIIIMDEPTSDLDPRHRRMLISFLKDLNQSTQLIVSHDLDFLWDTCTRIVLLNDGKLICHGPAQDILSNHQLLTENGLELPLRLQH